MGWGNGSSFWSNGGQEGPLASLASLASCPLIAKGEKRERERLKKGESHSTCNAANGRYCLCNLTAICERGTAVPLLHARPWPRGRVGRGNQGPPRDCGELGRSEGGGLPFQYVHPYVCVQFCLRLRGVCVCVCVRARHGCTPTARTALAAWVNWARESGPSTTLRRARPLRGRRTAFSVCVLSLLCSVHCGLCVVCATVLREQH